MKEELRGWTSFAEHIGESSASCATSRFRQAEERADALRTEAVQRSQRIVQLEVRISELESSNAALAISAKSSDRQALELKKAHDRLKVLSGDRELLARLQSELIEVRGEKQRLSDKMCVIEADCRQYQEELQSSQESLEKVRAELRKLKQRRECERATATHDGDDTSDAFNVSSLTRAPVHEHAKVLETVEGLKQDIATKRMSMQPDSGSDGNVEALKVRVDTQAEEIVQLKAQLDALSVGQEMGYATRTAGADGEDTLCSGSTNPFDSPSHEEELQAATQAMQQAKTELEDTNITLQKVSSEHAELVQEMQRQHAKQLQLADGEISDLQYRVKELQDEANRLGEEGEVDESMKKMTEVEALKVKKDGLENPHFPGMEERERK